MTHLVEQAKLQEIGVRKTERGRDLTSYEVVVEEAGQILRAVVDDMSMVPQLDPLLAFLRSRAKAVPLDT